MSLVRVCSMAAFLVAVPGAVVFVPVAVLHDAEALQ